MDSFSAPSSASSSQMSPENLMDQLKTQLAQAYAEEFLQGWPSGCNLRLEGVPPPGLSIGAQGTYGQVASSSHIDRMVIAALLLCPMIQAIGKAASYKLREQTVRGKCFEKCITKPGSSLSGSESSCTSRCVDRYIEATGIISRALFSFQR
ncbi:hypothetical protein HYC85_004165 [Camellia sinensis]|uniref:Mitochondrial import inner membrane translocase subunit n=1 Tax=Camellia sinensis TaxID=4442 RepID=A0A7J7HVQ5_CAMSI|nr:hypothetical protein HYC85_004165 [Camellia sinensis]